ncbi:MAG: cupredoxin family protein [Afipia sp.]|nr:cupredoxin family protein [Afipia sp.]
MTIWQDIRTGVSVFATLTGLTTMASAHGHHGGYSAGEPGNAKKPSREIAILMSEMDYTPSKIEVKRGEQIRFVIRNVGSESHEFLLASTADNLKHAEAMKKNPDMEHDEPNGLKLASKKSGEILWKFTKAGTFEYSCLIPTHREFGMIGKVVVK